MSTTDNAEFMRRARWNTYHTAELAGKFWELRGENRKRHQHNVQSLKA